MPSQEGTQLCRRGNSVPPLNKWNPEGQHANQIQTLHHTTTPQGRGAENRGFENIKLSCRSSRFAGRGDSNGGVKVLDVL